MPKILPEENGNYGIDCSNALWATSEIQSCYHHAKLHLLKNADFIIETESELLIVEYKNACIPNACNSSTFDPKDDKTVNSIILKYYGTLPYLAIKGKHKPGRFIYVLEYPNGDSVTRKRLRERIMKELPFKLQEDMKTGIKMITRVDVLSIDEWNHNPVYSRLPLVKLT